MSSYLNPNKWLRRKAKSGSPREDTEGTIPRLNDLISLARLIVMLLALIGSVALFFFIEEIGRIFSQLF
jgi:hypothetical protein